MAFTLAAFGEDIDAAGATVNITAVQDDHLFTSGDDVRVPTLNQLAFLSGGLGSGGDGLMRVETPSLRGINRIVVAPLNHLADSDAEPSDPIAVLDLSKNPRQLDTDEIMQTVIDSDTSAAAFQWCIVGFSDGVASKPSGQVITVRATSTTTVTARAWTSCPLTFADRLEVGNYQVVGGRFVGATAVAGRLIFKPGTWRPGAIGMDSQVTLDYPIFRMGGLGVWGEFHSTTPPDAEFLCDAADSAQTVDLDLIRVS